MSGRDPAEARLWILTGVRLAGALLVLGSFVLVARDQLLLAVPLAIAGFIAVAVLPRRLLRRWREDR
jgi:hypothetical protein